MEIRNGAKGNKSRRYAYSDSDREDLSTHQLQKLETIAQLYLTLRKNKKDNYIILN